MLEFSGTETHRRVAKMKKVRVNSGTNIRVLEAKEQHDSFLRLHQQPTLSLVFEEVRFKILWFCNNWWWWCYES